MDYDFELEAKRGDSINFKFPIINKNGDSVPLDDIDTLIVTCRKYPDTDSEIIFQKTKDDITYEDEYYHVQILPEDTATIKYGSYYIDIEATGISGYRKTKLGNLVITQEVTIHE